MEIKYYAANSTMGDTSADDCEKYREWAEEQIQAEYPDYDVQVLNREGGMVEAHTDDDDNRDEIIDFCTRLWDRCPWDFETENFETIECPECGLQFEKIDSGDVQCHECGQIIGL